MFKMRRLLATLAVYETGSVLKAADRAFLSQPAVTSAVLALESDLGEPLFARTRRGMAPLISAQIFCARIEAAMGHLNAWDAALMSKGASGVHRIPIVRLATDAQLVALAAVVETGGFSLAARRLGQAQPTIHRAARELEQSLGVPLLRQDGNRTEATSEAKRLAHAYGLFVRELEAGVEELRAQRGIADGMLNIGALPLAAANWVPSALRLTLDSFPDARVRIMDGPYDEQIAALLGGRIDFVLGALRMPEPAGVDQRWAFNDPLLIIVRPDHPFAAEFDSDHDKLTNEQLESLSWILPRLGTPARLNFESFLAAKDIPTPRHVVECSSLVATRALLLKGDYAAALSRQQVEIEVAQGLLKVMGPPLTGSSRAIGVSYRRGFRPTKLQEVFLESLLAVSATPKP